jgi:hypothetical protein
VDGEKDSRSGIPRMSKMKVQEYSIKEGKKQQYRYTQEIM